jgi:hypothetical protein
MLAMTVAATVSGAGAVTLRYKAKVGDVARYTYAETSRTQTAFDGEQSRSEDTVTELIIQKITNVDGDVFTIEEKSTKRKSVSKSDDEEPETTRLPDETTVTRIDAQGRNRSDEANGGDASDCFDYIADAAFGEIGAFPERDIKAGDSWSDDTEITCGQSASVKLRYTRTLVALETYQGHECAKIETKFGMAMEFSPDWLGIDEAAVTAFTGTLRFSGSITTWFDYAAGNEIADEATLKAVGEGSVTLSAAGAGADVEHTFKLSSIMNMKMMLQEPGSR